MCGINGFTSSDQERLQAMNRCTAHRGPDGSGFFVDENVSIGHNLLAIVDLPANSTQPVVSPDRMHVLAYNGEIYNYKELRDELSKEGDTFSTNSDTEVLFKGLDRHGAEFLKKLDGMFACAWYDAKKQTMLIARDGGGMKPMYYACDPNSTHTLVFSSELRGLKEFGIPFYLDHEMAGIYFMFGYVPGHRTLLKDVFKVCPGQYITFDIHKGELQKTWFRKEASRETATFDPSHLRSLISESVSKHTMGLRPYGLYLSGGLDSTIILHELAKTQKEKVKTYTTRFDTPVADYNEDADRAARLSSSYEIEHHELMIHEKAFIDATEKVISAVEEPRYNHSLAAYWLLAQEASKDIVTVLIGNGGDELFLGYPRYKNSLNLTKRYAKYTAALLNLAYTLKAMREKKISFGHSLHLDQPLDRWAYLNALNVPYGNSSFRSFDADLSDAITYLQSIRMPMGSHPSSDMENAISELDRLFWVADEDFIRTDKIAMHFSMEGRFPFLARDIVDYAHRISSSEKMKNGELKSIIRRTYRGVLPDYITEKKKSGWNAPVSEWMSSKYGDMVRSVLSKGYNSTTADMFDFDLIHQNHLNPRDTFTLAKLKQFLPIFSFQLWMKLFDVKP